MRSELRDPDHDTTAHDSAHDPAHDTARSAARSAVAVSVAALITAAALFGALAPRAAALPLPLPPTGVESLVTEGVTIEGPLIDNISSR
ncbi:hypothetical protein [Streptomyces mutabilis]|uniref:hypothetical protein n=1 Tax=Streptomyces mutabilis TaxID=67332 RepID=UPI0005BCDC49|nr:hypothetical protein [Streptomyces mutabilis]